MEDIKIDDSFYEKLYENILAGIEECRRRLIEAVSTKGDDAFNGKPNFDSDNPEFTKQYECDEFTCNAHPRGCLFCEHCSDVLWDYTHGPYMFMCDIGESDYVRGFMGKCKSFQDEKQL